MMLHTNLWKCLKNKIITLEVIKVNNTMEVNIKEYKKITGLYWMDKWIYIER